MKKYLNTYSKVITMGDEQQKKRIENLIKRALLIDAHLRKIVDAEKAAFAQDVERTRNVEYRMPIPGYENPPQMNDPNFENQRIAYYARFHQFVQSKESELERLSWTLVKIYGLLQRYQKIFHNDIAIEEGIKQHTSRLRGELDTWEHRMRSQESAGRGGNALHYYPQVQFPGGVRNLSQVKPFELEKEALERLSAEVAAEMSQEDKMRKELEFLYQTFIASSKFESSLVGEIRGGILGHQRQLPKSYGQSEMVNILPLAANLTSQFREYAVKFIGVIRELLVELSNDRRLEQNIEAELQQIFAEFKQPLLQGKGNASARRIIKELERAHRDAS